MGIIIQAAIVLALYAVGIWAAWHGDFAKAAFFVAASVSAQLDLNSMKASRD